MNLGANFQADVSAFFACVSLAEDVASLPVDVVPSTVSPESPTRIGAELSWPTDDIAIWLGAARLWFFQAKASISLGSAATSELAEVMDQFVRQWKHGRANEANISLTPDDRMILIVGAESAGTVREDLRTLLERIATLAPNEALEAATRGQTKMKTAFDRVLGHVRRSLTAAGKAADDSTVREVLTHVRVWATTQETLQHVSRTLLSAHVVSESKQAGAALNILQRYFADAAQRRSSHDTRALRSLLRNAGITLKEARSIASDVARLRDDTAAVLRAELRVLRTREGNVRIARAILPDVIAAVQHGDLIITGEAGAGKSDVVTQAAQTLLDTGHRVVYLDATDPRMADPTRALRLGDTLESVLARWGDAGDVGYLFIDGFDSTRIGQSYDVLVRVVRRLQPSQSRSWHVVVASREYDLLHGAVLADLFPYDAGQPMVATHRDARFAGYSHIVIPRLTRAEIDEVAGQSLSLASVIAAAGPALLDLLENPFNLSIAASFAIGGDAVPDLSQIRTQSELLDVWWSRRVVAGAQSQTKERILRDLAREMVRQRRLRLPRESLAEDAGAEDLLSSSVLVPVGPRHESIAFTHLIVFDHAVDSLLLAHEGGIASLLADDRDAFLFVLPALQMRFDYLWTLDRARFFREFTRLFADGTQRRTLLLLVGRIIYDRFEEASDLMPLLDTPDERSDVAIRFLVRTLIHEREQGHEITGAQRPKWIALVNELAQRLPRFDHDALLLLSELLRQAA